MAAAASLAQLPGTIVGWGYNDFGQCVPPDPNSGFVGIAGGPANSLGLKAADGSIIPWGQGPVGIPEPNSGFAAVAAGQSFSLGLRSNGTIDGWGNNGHPYYFITVPPPNAGFVSISATNLHSLALRSDGSVAAWGRGDEGACTVPFPNSGFVAVAAGGYHSLGLKANGSIVGWGRNNAGQCDIPEPNSGYVAIGAGEEHSLAIRADGSIEVFGEHNQEPFPNTGFVAVAGGIGSSLALKADGSVVAWGENGFGQSNEPIPNEGFEAIASGWYHNLAIKTYSPALPSGFSLFRGVLFSGGISSLFHTENNRLQVRPGVTLTSGEAPIQIIISGTSASQSPSRLRFLLEARASATNLTQKLELFDYAANAYVLMNSRPATTGDSYVEVSAANPARFVQANTRAMRARLSWKQSGPIIVYPYLVGVDLAFWKVTP
jgi:alpha-tubulin suppressor-like RCC1 family protein